MQSLTTGSWMICAWLPNTSCFVLRGASSLQSGYSRFPVHEKDDPSAFIGLLLVKKVGCSSCSPNPWLRSRTRAYLSSSCWGTIPLVPCPYPRFRSRSCQKHIRISAASRLWTTCDRIPHLFGLSADQDFLLPRRLCISAVH